MALVQRAITGTIEKSDGTLWANAPVIFEISYTQADGEITVPKQSITVYTNASGVFSANLYTLEGSYLNYTVQLPNGESVEFSFEDLGEVTQDLSDLLLITASAAQIAIRPATEDALGGIRIGDGLEIDEEGIVSVSGGGGGVTDHGALTGLADDDHPQYLNTARGDARYYTESEMDTALALKAPLANPALSGTPTAPTPAPGTNTTQIATTAFVEAVRLALIDGAPAGLNTLEELAAALGDDPDFAATMGAEFAQVLYKSQNLSGLTDTAAARTNIGLGNVPNTDATQRANHTGTQTASTISDFASTVRGTALTGLGAGTNTAILATDTILEAFAKLQNQITNFSGGGIGGTLGATDNVVPRADGTGGGTLQASAVSIDDSGNVSGANNLNFSGRLIGSGAGNYISWGDSQFGDVLADGHAVIGYNSGGKSVKFRDNAGVISAQIDSNAGAGNTRLLVYDVDNATLERVSVGAADSGGSGFKVLRIPN